jgi:WD40 repeat protein
MLAYCIRYACCSPVDPNEYSLFQPNTKLCDAASKLVVYYHPKACSLTTVYDLAPPSISGRGSSAKIVGECYTAFKLKDVLTALGGVQSLLPLLEYIRQPVCIFHSPSEGEPDEVSAEKRVFDARGTTSVSLFMSILTTMLTSNPVNLQLFGLNDGPAILGALLAKVPPEQITVPVLGSLQLLIESALHSSTNEEKLPPIVKHVLFNFIIWTKPAYDVRIGHIQYLGAVVKDRPSLCHKEWGPQFLLDIISRYYLPGHMDEEESDVRLTVEQASHIRVGLLSCIKYYAHSELSAQEVDDIVHFTLAVGDEDVQLEMLQLILDLVLKRNIGDSLPSILTDVGAPLVAFMKAPQIKIRLLVTQVFCALFNTRGISSGRAHDCLQHGAVESAVHNMLNHTLSSALIIALMELCVRKSDSFTDYISSLGVYMALLDLLKKLDMVVRYTVCQQTLSLLHFNPHHIGEVTACPQWEVTLLGLLSSTREAKSPSPTNFPMSPGSPGEAPSLGSGTPVDMPTRLLSIVMEIVGLILWGAATSGDHVKVWRRFFLYVDLYSEDNEMMLPAHILKQHIFDTLIKLLKRQVDEMGPSGVTTLCRPALTLSVLFEEFVTGNHMIDLPQSPVHQLVDLALDPKRCTPELLKSFLSLMQSLGIYQSHFIDSNEVALCRVINRLLLACLCQNNREYCCYGARELQEFLNSSKMSANDGFFTLLCLVQALDQCGDSDLESDCRDYIVTAVRSLLLKFGQVLNTLTLKHLPAVESNPMFVKEFLTYRKSEEWEYFMRDKVRKSCGVFCTEALIPDVEKMKFITEELRKDIQTAEGERQALLSQNDRYYNLQVLDTVVMILEKENNRPTAIHQLEGQHQTAVNVWKQAKRFFKEERGVWSSRKSDKYSWKLDRTENFSRMRMKLSRSYPYNSHTEASILRDQGDIALSEVENIVKELLKAKDSVLPSVLPDGGSNTDDLFDEAESTLVETPTLPKQFDGLTDAVERSVCDVKCQLVLLTEKFNGSLEVTTTHISFEPEKKESRDSFWYNNDFKIPIVQLREIHSRRYNLVRTALEFFLIDQTNYFVNFESRRDVRKVFNCIVAQNTPNLIYKKLRTPRELLESSELTKKWIRREISNFDYLMQLNTIAGRTYNDLNQYPVFPWILKDYTSPTLDLTSSAVFRNLSKPMGCQSEALEMQAIERYEEFEDPTGDIPKFHYGTHYSNAAGVMHYLLRLEPFTTLHIQLQSGRFDATARQFISLGRSYQSILATSSDVKELIPEFFYLPEMFVNLNRYNLGKTGAEVVDSVELPTWASSAEDFVRKHKEALESEYVSQHLHEWIDLIFGFKQQGPEAVKALNVFYYCTYEGKVDLSNASQSNREVLEKMIESFGQTPSQLFKSPHPTRLSVEEASKALRAEYQSGSAHNDFCNIFENFEELKAYAVDISSQDPIVFVSIPAVRGHAIIESGNPEKLITVTASGVLNIHSWLSAHFAFKKRPFVFHIDPNTYEDRSKWHYLGGPFAHNVAPSQNMFVASRTNKLLVSGGHWDNSFRVISSDKGKIIARVEYHQDIVTCMSLDPSGAHLITGSRDLTCAIWDFGKEAKLFEHPLRTLYGHDDVVTCVDISLELDIAVSGSQDGTVIIHTVQQGRYVHTLKPESASEDEHRPRVVRLVAISKKGRIVVYSELQPSVDKVRLDPCLHLYSINGKLLLSESAKDRITAMLIHEGFLVTGSDSGVLLFRDIFDLMRLTRLDVKAGVSCLALTRELSHLLVGLENGKLLIVSPPKKR